MKYRQIGNSPMCASFFCEIIEIRMEGLRSCDGSIQAYKIDNSLEGVQDQNHDLLLAWYPFRYHQGPQDCVWVSHSIYGM